MTRLNPRILLPLLLLAGLPADAATNIFTNSTADGLWGTAGNWSEGTVPVSADTAVINAGKVVTVAANAPAVGIITVGNTDTSLGSTTMNIQADLTADTVRVATANGSFGAVTHTAGNLTINSGFQIAANNPTADSASYTISGGILDFSGASNLLLGTQGPGTLTIDGSAVTVVNGSSLIVGAQGTVEFKLDTFGVTPIQITTNVNVNATGQLVVDGTDYEGLDGYFPLMSYDAIGPQFDPGNVTFTGLDDRAPALVYESGGLWLRLGAPPAYSEKLLSLVPESTVAPDYTASSFSATRAFDPSGSDWATTYNEGHVMDTLLEVDVAGEPNLSFALRVARGGNIYSLRTSAGETVPPQFHAGDTAPWIDEVWQAVGVDGALNDPGNGSPWFIHQAGVYLRDPILTEPFYSPQVAAHLDAANRSFTTINWGQQAHIGIFTDADPLNDWQSHLLYFTRYKDLGQGVMEVSIGYYNYGPDEPEFFNVPWGGTRRTTMNHGFLANPVCDNAFSWSAAKTDNVWSSTVPYNNSGGWFGFSSAQNGAAPALGTVFGRDPSPLLPEQFSNTVIRWGFAGGPFQPGETDWRNFLATEQARFYTLSQGNGFWSRHYIATGDSIADMADHIAARDLASGVAVSPFDFTESNSPLIGYSFTGSGASFQAAADEDTPQFYLYAHPVTGSFPIYEMIESDGSRYLSWNPYGTGVIKTYDGTIAGIRLLGFALRSADINVAGTAYTYQPLAPVFAGVPDNYKPSGEVFSVRTTGDTADDDGDGLANFVETSVHGSDPNQVDTDGDGYTDPQEVAIGANPAVDDSGLIALITAAVGGETSRIQLTPSGDDFIVTVKVQESTDLSAFSDLDLTGVNTTVDAGADTVTITISGAAASKFLRIGK